MISRSRPLTGVLAGNGQRGRQSKKPRAIRFRPLVALTIKEMQQIQLRLGYPSLPSRRLVERLPRNAQSIARAAIHYGRP